MSYYYVSPQWEEGTAPSRAQRAGGYKAID